MHVTVEGLSGSSPAVRPLRLKDLRDDDFRDFMHLSGDRTGT
jgi:hypothetical protein